MTAVFILIVYFMPMYGGGLAIEFDDHAACELAAEQLMAEGIARFTLCTPKATGG